MVKHRVLKPSELAPLLRFKKPQFNGKSRRLAAAHTIADLRAIAKRRIPTGPFDYADGAAEGELSIARARQAFQDIEFSPSILRDVSHIDTSREVLGSRVEQPFGIAPTGFTRMLHTDGEVAGASVAGAAGIPFALSTMGTTSIPDVQRANPAGRNWLQLYMWKDRQRSVSIMERAALAGFDTLLVTVDVPVSGARLRDYKNGFSVPPQLTLRTIANALPRPEWWFNFLTTDPPGFAVLESGERMDTKATLSDYVTSMFDPTVDFEDLQWIRDQWPGKVVVKGVQNVEDARAIADLGLDGIVLSNHGVRQLDRAPIPFHLLPAVVKEVGADLEVHLDTGIMSGADIVAAIALGARFTLVGRAYLYGLMAGGKEGVERAVTILSDEIARTMRLLGVTSLDELEPAHVRQLNL